MNTAQAQDKKRSIYFEVGVSSGYGYPSELSARSKSSIPTISIGAGFPLSKFFHAGVYAAYTYHYFTFDNPQSGYKDVWKGWDIGLKNTFHIGKLFLKTEKLDLYLGVITGYTKRSRVHLSRANVPDYYYDILNYKKDAITVGGLGGLKYFINKRIGLYGEIGYTRQLFMGAGVSIKLNKQFGQPANNRS